MNEKFIFHGIGRARNGEHYEFIRHLLRSFTDADAVILNIQPHRDRLAGLFNREDEALKQILSYEQTRSVSHYDTQRDELFRYINTEVRNQQRSPLAGKKAAACHLAPLMKSYNNTAVRAQRDETGLLVNLVAELQSAAYAAHVATLGLVEAVEAMQTANEAFREAFYRRVDEKAYRQATGTMKAIRPEVDKAYLEVLTMLNSLYNVYTLTPSDFADQITLLERLSEALNASANDMRQAILIRRSKGNH